MKYYAYLVIAFLFVTACNPEQRQDEHWENVQQMLQQLDDSVKERSTAVPTMIRRGLDTAADSIEWYAYYIRWAGYFSMSDTPDSLLPYTLKTIRFAKRNTPAGTTFDQRRLNEVAGMAYEQKASLYQHFRKQNDSVFHLHKRAYELISQSEATQTLPIICGNLADAYALHNRLPEASSWYRRALRLTDSLQLGQNVRASLYMGLGRIYTNLLDYDNAKLYYGLAVQRLDSLPPHERLYYLNNYGNYFYYQKQYDEALQQFDKMEQLLHKLGAENTFEMYLCLVNKGDVYLNLNRTVEALDCIEKSEPFFRKNQVEAAILYCQIIRFGIAVKENNMVQAEQLLPEVMRELSVERGIIDIRNRYVFDYYQKAGRVSDALQLLLAEDQYEDSVSNRRARMRAAEIMMRVSEDTLRLRHQLEMEQQRTETQQAYTGMALMAILILLLLAALAAWWLYMRKKETQHEMDMLQLRLLGIRQRVSPHFVFNVLNHRIGSADENEEKELLKLVKLIRENLDMSSNALIPLAEELRFVKDFVGLEQELMDNLVYTTDIQGDINLDELMVPSMFVQILAENAVKHGLKGLPGRKELNIKVEQQEDTFTVTVTDNGRGLEKREGKRSSTGSGLKIIRQTMEIFNAHNPKHTMRLDLQNRGDDRGHPKGCQATLQIPIMLNDLS